MDESINYITEFKFPIGLEGSKPSSSDRRPLNKKSKNNSLQKTNIFITLSGLK